MTIKTSDNFTPFNRAFLEGDAVRVSFFVVNAQLIMAEECYFYLMACMRKMRMNIPLSYTLEFFQNLFSVEISNHRISDAIINFWVYRDADGLPLQKSKVSYVFEIQQGENILNTQNPYRLDIIKEVQVNTHLLSHIRVYAPENIYAHIYAKENDLDDVILLNPSKRIARTTIGNLLFLEGNTIKTPKQTEGAYISPLMENFVTFVHKNRLAAIEQVELIAFESQKADEILIVSDSKGMVPVSRIRNKSFDFQKFSEILQLWRTSFSSN